MHWLLLPVAFIFAFTTAAGAAPGATPNAAPSATPSVATTVPGADSIKLSDCKLQVGSFSGVAAKLHVEFTNLTTETLTHIRFRVTARTTFAVMDIGSFAPNVKIKHDLDPPPANVIPYASARTLPGVMGGLGCSIDAYTLQSGYTWVSPQLQKELSQPTVAH
jgi:hypothetical protein